MGFDTSSLKSMCELIADCPHSTPEWTDQGYIVTRNQNIRNGVLNLDSPSFTTKADFLKRIKRAEPRAGDIIFTREAPMGEVCIIPEGLTCCLGQRQVLLRPKRNVSGEYLFWALQSPFVQHQISWSEGTGSTVSNVRIPVLEALRIPRHNDVESKIGEVLSNLARKIEVNRQTNQTLEQIAQAIFKSWFVDFEPTRAKIATRERWLALHEVIETSSPTCYSAEFDNANQPTQTLEEAVTQAAMAAISGKTPEELDQLSPDQQQNLRNIAALFPDTLVDSELGEIPEGWLVSPLSVWGDIICGKTPSKKNDEYYGGDIPLVKIPDMHNSMFVTGTSDTLTALGAATQKRKLLPAGSICVSCIATVGKVVITTKECFTNQQINSIVPKNKFFTPYLYFSMLKINDLLHDLASGGSATLNLNTGNFSRIEILKPTFEVLQEYYILVEPILKQVLVNQEEQQTLSALRDSLLPKLLSGQLHIPNSENQVTEATA